jgi:hypothetical protein
MTHFFGVILAPSRRKTARPHASKSFMLPFAPQKPLFFLVFCVVDDAKVSTKERFGAV